MQNKNYYICYIDYINGGTGRFIHLYSEEEREKRLNDGSFDMMVELDGNNKVYHQAASWRVN